MRRAGRLAAKLLDHLADMVKPGVSTLEINDEAERLDLRTMEPKVRP
jgi:methionyl aminopeptidase